jgi:hypothetical protein
VSPLDPEQLDARNMLGVIYAGGRQGPRDPRDGVSYSATRRTTTQRAPTWRSSTASELLPRPIPH